MRISKHYFDCISAQGEVFVGYFAVLSLFGVKLSYESFLLQQQTGLTRRENFGRASSRVSLAGDDLTWESSRLGLKGKWARRQALISQVLYASPEAQFSWNCTMPRAAVEIAGPQVPAFSGQGYAEELRLEFRKARLPFNRLYWGRAHIENETIVWISFDNPGAKPWVWLNGVVLTGQIEGEGDIKLTLGAKVLELTPRRVIEDRHVYSAAPRILRPPLRRILDAHERKWLCHASLKQDSKVSHGQAVSELVTWNKG